MMITMVQADLRNVHKLAVLDILFIITEEAENNADAPDRNQPPNKCTIFSNLVERLHKHTSLKYI